MTDAYILEGHEVKPSNFQEWAKWFERASKDGSRIIEKTIICEVVRVSTVFIGLQYEIF
jgi:hypothetical protein